MNALIRAWLLVALLSLASGAYAQRQLVPVVNFEAIPVAMSTSKALTAEQVKAAFIGAADGTPWELVPKGPGVIEATYRKGNKHTVVVEVTHDAQTYSVRYVSSVNMKYEADPRNYEALYTNRQSGATAAELAAKKQQESFSGSPDAPYAKPDAKAVIHPFYERWVHELLDGVRKKLRTIE